MQMPAAKKRLTWRGLAICAIAAAAQCMPALADDTPDEIIARRQAGYKHIGEIFGAMKKQGIDIGADVTQFAARAKEIADWGRTLTTLFPAGTETGHDTRALPAIWSDRATFDADAADLVANAEKLAQAAQSGDHAAFAAQWKAAGAVCGGCHRLFRAKKD